jgi:hypothetical protein
VTGNIDIEHEGKSNPTINHGNLTGKKSSSQAPPAMATTATSGPQAPVRMDSARVDMTQQ